MDRNLDVTIYHPLVVVVVVIAAIFGYLTLRYPVGEMYRHNDFAHYYISADLLRQGENPYAKPIRSLYPRYGLLNRPPINHATNPPALVLLTVPLAVLSPARAFALWTVIQLLAYGAALLLVCRLVELRLEPLETALLMLASVLMYPATSHLMYGQTQMLIFFLLVLGLSLVARGTPRGVVLGVFLWGLASSLKLFTYPLLYVAFLVGRRKGVIWFLLGFFSLHLLLLVFAPAEVISDFYTVTIGRIHRTMVKFQGNTSLTGAIVHTIRIASDGSTPITPLLVRLLDLLSSAVLAIGLVFHFVRYGKRHDPIFTTAMVLVLSCLCSPTCWSHYGVFFMLPILVVLKSSSVFTPGGLPPLLPLVAYLLTAFICGHVEAGGLVVELVSSWLGVLAMGYLLALLLYQQGRASTAERSNGSVAKSPGGAEG
jgi:hypothetical protein